MFPKHDQKPDVRHHKEWGQASLSIDRLIWYKKKWYKESSKPTDYFELQCFLRSDTCTPWPNALMIDSKNNDMLVNLYFLLDHITHCGSFKLGNLWRDKNVRLCRLCSAPTIWASNWFCILGSLTAGSPPLTRPNTNRQGGFSCSSPPLLFPFCTAVEILSFKI